MWSTPSSMARRRTARAASGSRGGPKTPGPASCMAPKPIRPTGLSPRKEVWVIQLRLGARRDRAQRRGSAQRGDEDANGPHDQQARPGKRGRGPPRLREAGVDADPRRGHPPELVHEQVPPGREEKAGEDDELATG